MTQLIYRNETPGQICKGCGKVKRLGEFPRAARREGRGTWCSECERRNCAAKNYAFSRAMVARRLIQGGTAALND